MDRVSRTGYVTRASLTVGIAALVALAFSPGVGASFDPATERKASAPEAYPSQGSVRAAKRFARVAGGLVSFAVIDAKGGLRGFQFRRQYASASVSKALLLAAELRRLRRTKSPLDPQTTALLRSMITRSDNNAAHQIYARVGDAGLANVARHAGMRHFGTVGFWAGARITAADAARFFFRLNQNLVGPHRGFAKNLLTRIVGDQRWGIPPGAPKGWRIFFKGGWRSGLTHQAGLLIHRGGQRVAIAVLTNGQPSMTTGEALIEGIARRLLARKPPAQR